MTNYQARCAYCGSIFLSKRKNVKYCSKQCADRFCHRTKSPRDAEQIAYNKQRIVELFNLGMNGRSIAKEIGKNESFVYTTLKEYGLRHQRTNLQQEVKEYRNKGLCCTEIAEALGKKPKQIRQIAINIGMPFTEEEKARSIEIGKRKCKEIQYGSEAERREKQIIYISENHPGWTYISGWIASDGIVELRCNCCTSIVKKSAVSIRHHKHLVCPVCEEENKKQRELQRKREQENNKRIRIQKKSEKFWNNFWKQEYRLPDVKKCRYCGALHVGNGQFCSDDCRRKHTNRQHDRRIRRVLKKDMSINLEKLYNRDNGICWICGGQCNYDDYHYDENKSFIVGNDYPSIDHVFPLSKGGSHTWENVRLAHHHCNTLKSDKVVW